MRLIDWHLCEHLYTWAIIQILVNILNAYSIELFTSVMLMCSEEEWMNLFESYMVLPRAICDNIISLHWDYFLPKCMTASSNGNIFRVTGLLWGEFTGHRWIPHTKASDAELWYFLDQWVYNGEAGDLRRLGVYYDLIVTYWDITKDILIVFSW